MLVKLYFILIRCCSFFHSIHFTKLLVVIFRESKLSFLVVQGKQKPHIENCFHEYYLNHFRFIHHYNNNSPLYSSYHLHFVGTGQIQSYKFLPIFLPGVRWLLQKIHPLPIHASATCLPWGCGEESDPLRLPIDYALLTTRLLHKGFE